MPPYGEVCPPAAIEFSPKKQYPSIITLNVGGQMFQTTPQTLALAGPTSPLYALCSSGPTKPHPSSFFFDRDPDLFSILLSLLRTGNLPSRAHDADLQDLIAEARFFRLESLLLSALSDPSQFDPFNLHPSLLLPLHGRDLPSALSSTSSGSLHVAHGSNITSFDWSLVRKSTILTHFSAVDSLLALSPSLAAAGATDFSGLHILDLHDGSVRHTLTWENATRSSSTVQAIGASPDFLFASFESGRRNSNAIMLFDLAADAGFRPVAEIGHGEIYGAELDSAIPATKLQWIPNLNLLMASGSHGGPSGLLGSIRLFDLRSPNVVFELREKQDCFSDITVSDDLPAMFKVGVTSGGVFVGDLRNLGGEDLWASLGVGECRKPANNGKKEGAHCRIQSHGNQVFCSRGGDVELWSEVPMGSYKSVGDGLQDRVFRRSLLGRGKDLGGCRIAHMGFGGNKMFLARKDQQFVEVWQSSGRI